MDEQTARLGLPLLLAGQAQKETTHNEALALIDLGLHAAVVAVGLNVPPADPEEGACWVVGDDPTGAWAERAGALAGWTDGGWRFLAPRDGFAVWDSASGLQARFAAGEWTVGSVVAARVLVGGEQVLGARGAAIANPSGGAAPDAQARGAIGQILEALRTHGLIAA